MTERMRCPRERIYYSRWVLIMIIIIFRVNRWLRWLNLGGLQGKIGRAEGVKKRF